MIPRTKNPTSCAIRLQSLTAIHFFKINSELDILEDVGLVCL
jgi:hypothetical protein